MAKPKIFYSFRVRLLLLLTLLVAGTLGVQFYLNRRGERRTARLIAGQERALIASVALANESITSGKYMYQLEERRGRSLLGEQAGRVLNILAVSQDGRVDDSLDPRYRPETLSEGQYHYFHISDPEVPLPRLVDAGEATEGFGRLLPSLPTTTQPVAGEPRTFAIPLQTTTGVTYTVVVLGSALPGPHSHWEDVEPLLPTLGLGLVALLAAGLLALRFTRPLSELSAATGRVAAGDFDVRVPVTGRRDEIGSLVSTFNEMTARLARTFELERQLQQAERSAMVGRFASAIAHEVKNPLNYINLSLDHMRTTLAPEDERKRELFSRLTAQIKEEVARINTRIREFLQYSRPSKPELRPLDLRAEVADAFRIAEMQAGEAGVEARLDVSEEVPAVRGDPEWLRSVFTNLMINALQAMEGRAGGRLTVRVSREGGGARVEVSDTGKGVSPESLEHIFEPYFSTKETGTGLGLAIVKKAVEEHGGSVTVESKEGEGTTFTVTLPAGSGEGGELGPDS